MEIIKFPEVPEGGDKPRREPHKRQLLIVSALRLATIGQTFGIQDSGFGVRLARLAKSASTDPIGSRIHLLGIIFRLAPLDAYLHPLGPSDSLAGGRGHGAG